MRRGRGKNPNENPGVKPVQRIELSEGSTTKRIIAAALLLAIGLGFLGYALFQGLSRKPGWTQIEPMSPSAESVSFDLTLLYDLGASGRSPTAEYRELSALYTELCAKAFRIFHAQYGYEDVYNPYYLNRHPGEPVTVEPALYSALEKNVTAQSRILFAAPYYREYSNLFQDTEDASAALVDPYKSEEIAEYFQELSVFTSDPEHVRLELLGNNTVRLVVSQEYLSYASQNGIESFIDFYWMRNAFAVDYIAQEMTAWGYGYGAISSYDGFVRNFDSRNTGYSYDLYGMLDNQAYNAARLDYNGSVSLVFLRSFRINDRDDMYYSYQDGEKRHPYVDPADGFCKNASESIALYSPEGSCADVLLTALPVYIQENLDADQLAQLESGMYYVCLDGDRIVYNDPALELRNVHSKFTASLVN